MTPQRKLDTNLRFDLIPWGFVVLFCLFVLPVSVMLILLVETDDMVFKESWVSGGDVWADIAMSS